jgi:hypothetical protein
MLSQAPADAETTNMISAATTSSRSFATTNIDVRQPVVRAVDETAAVGDFQPPARG